MLNYLKQQGFAESLVQGGDESFDGAGDNSDKQNKEQHFTVSDRKVRARNTTIMLALLFGVGLLCLWFMIKKSVPKAAAADVIDGRMEIEMAIARLDGGTEVVGGMEDIIQEFYDFSDVDQVKAGELVKNPFKRDIFAGNPNGQLENSGVSSEVLREQQLRKKAKSLELLSIMQAGPTRCCMIENKILYEGDSVEDFNIKQIGDGFVTLESDGLEIVLRISE